MASLPDPGLAAQRTRLLALLAQGDLDAALLAGLMEFPALPGRDGDAPRVAAQARLRTAWEARARHQARAQRLARIAAVREARPPPTTVPATPATAPGAAPGPALPPAAAAALARARARAAGRSA